MHFLQLYVQSHAGDLVSPANLSCEGLSLLLLLICLELRLPAPG